MFFSHLALLSDGVRIVPSVSDDSHLPEDFDDSSTGLVQELAIMGDDEIPSLPGIDKVLLEPLDTREIDEVRRFI